MQWTIGFTRKFCLVSKMPCDALCCCIPNKGNSNKSIHIFTLEWEKEKKNELSVNKLSYCPFPSNSTNLDEVNN